MCQGLATIGRHRTRICDICRVKVQKAVYVVIRKVLRVKGLHDCQPLATLPLSVIFRRSQAPVLKCVQVFYAQRVAAFIVVCFDMSEHIKTSKTSNSNYIPTTVGFDPEHPTKHRH